MMKWVNVPMDQFANVPKGLSKRVAEHSIGELANFQIDKLFIGITN